MKTLLGALVVFVAGFLAGFFALLRYLRSGAITG